MDMNDVTYWYAFGLSPLRMYSAGMFASSGATAIIASRDTSRKGGRARVRGSWTVGVGTGLAWWGRWWWAAKEVGWDATWSMLCSWMKREWTDYIHRLFHSPFWDIRLCSGVSLGEQPYVVPITPCSPLKNNIPCSYSNPIKILCHGQIPNFMWGRSGRTHLNAGFYLPFADLNHYFYMLT